MRWLQFMTLAVILLFGNVSTLSLDPVASGELEQCIKKGDCIISMRHIRPRRKLHISIEALFMIDFPTLKHKMSFFLDRKQPSVTLDISSNGDVQSKNFIIPHINETSIIRSLALQFQENRINLLVDCKETASHEIEMDLPSLYLQMGDDPVIKLFRERKYPLYFDSSIGSALQRANCQKGLPPRGNRRMLKSKISERERNKKRDVRNWFNNEPGRPENKLNSDVERGDIPVMHGDCEDVISKSLTDLLALIKLLREDIANQRKEIDYLRNLLENCAGCKETSSSLRVEPTCRTSNPCYPGVDCHETPTGLRCGRCPAGMIGDGKICKPGVTCADSPCYPGVLCRDSISGAHCGPCPIGYEGDGRTCNRRKSCLEGLCPGNILIPSHNVQHYQRQYTARKYSVIQS